MVSTILGGLEVDRSALEERVYAALRQKIVDRELAPGVVLTIRQVAAALNVSPTPVRDALRRLTVDGLLRDRGRLGAEVVGLSAADVTDIFEARIVLETQAARKIAVNQPGETLGELRRVQELWPAGADWDSDDNLKRASSCDAEFHRTLIAGAQNLRIVQFYESLGVYISLIRVFHPEVVFRADTNRQEHLAILTALEQGSPDAAVAAVSAHITNSCSDVLRLLSSDRLI